MMVDGGEPSLTTVGPPLTTTGQWWLTGSQQVGSGRVRVRSWVGSESGHGSGCHVAHSESATSAVTSACWSHVSPRRGATSADWVSHVYVAATSAADVAEGIYNPPAESNQRPFV
nr:hypothetical protein [Tanacetum cinerariifolium]